MSTVQDICNEIGREVLASAIGVSRQSISNAISDAAFPASWYEIIKRECDDRGLVCDLVLFKFKRHEKRDAA